MGRRVRTTANSRSTRLRGWRRMANAIWRAPSDPQIYGILEVEARPLLDFIQLCRGRGQHITPTHLVGRALGHALAQVPALNMRLVGGRAIPRSSVDVFFITALGEGSELSGVKVQAIDRKSAAAVALELDHESQQLRAGKGAGLERAKALMDRLPEPALRVGLRLVAWAAGERAWDLPLLGVTATPFGSAMVSSVGMFGLPVGFAPLVWLYRVPIIVVAGEIRDQPVAIDGRVEVRPVLPITASVDHRYVDGPQLGQALTAFRAYLEAPLAFESAP